MNELVKVTVQQIDKCGFFVDTETEIPQNLALMLQGLNKMYNDGIFEFKPHLKKERRDIYKISIDTNGVDDDIIQQIKTIATNKKCDVEINYCFHWLHIKNKKEDINKYFKEV